MYTFESMILSKTDVFASAQECGHPLGTVHEAADAAQCVQVLVQEHAAKTSCKRLTQEVPPCTPSKRLKQMPKVIAITDSPGVISCTSSPETASTKRHPARNSKLEKFVQMPRSSRNIKVEVKIEKGACVKQERIKREWNCKLEPASPSSNPFGQFGFVLLMC